MKSIEVYDPAMCCSTGVCGPDVDPELAQFAGLLARLGAVGILVERFGLGQQPMAFVRNAMVKALLEREGADVLPVIFCDGAIVLKGRYPDAAERKRWEEEAGIAP